MKNQHTCIFIAVRDPVIKRGVLTHHMFVSVPSQDLDFQPGADPGGGRTRRAPPLKLEKNKIFWRKIVIFHTKYPNIFALPPLGAIFLSAPPLT